MTGPAPPTPSAQSGFTIVATGDLLAHRPVMARARMDAGGRGYTFGRMLARVAPRIAAADLAICHVETPLSATNTDLSGYPVFVSPREIAADVAAAGYDTCSTASNHALDRGMAGITSTLSALDAAGVRHAGTARTAAEAARITMVTIGGVAVAHLSFTYGSNGIPAPRDAPWALAVTSVPAIQAAAHRARAAGARFVVVSMHWGTEYQVAPTAEQERQARALLGSPDVDLILGDHVHVQQPVRRIGDKYVVYGLGNLLSNQSPAHGLIPQTQDGAVITVHVRRAGERYLVDRVGYTATFCQVGPYTVWPVAAALADPATPATLRPALRASLARTKAIHDQGVARPEP
jgi:poly-gamma-glutamate synthesis protein (capsule biosynthesis protein)